MADYSLMKGKKFDLQPKRFEFDYFTGEALRRCIEKAVASGRCNFSSSGGELDLRELGTHDASVVERWLGAIGMNLDTDMGYLGYADIQFRRRRGRAIISADKRGVRLGIAF